MRKPTAGLFTSLDGYAVEAPDDSLGEELREFLDEQMDRPEPVPDDRLRVIVHPVVLGAAGRTPIFAGYDTTQLKLVETTVLDGRVVVLDYESITPKEES